MTDIIAELKQLVGEENVLDTDAARQRTLMWDTNQPCLAKALVRPCNTGEVSAILKLCHERRQSVVPYGGLTGLVQGSVTNPDDIAVSFGRMNNIEETDATAKTMTAQAGVTMQRAQEAADKAGLFFPVDIGARGACEVGGFVSTNAGGTKVIRYGMTRDCVLGLEAVLADGTIISSMNRYIKNNSGFDLKQLFIGSEGVLGVITRVVFRLSIKSTSHNVALVACRDYPTVIRLLDSAHAMLGSSLSGFEVMWDGFYRKATKPLGRQMSPFDEPHSVYVILETMGIDARSDEENFTDALEKMFEESLVEDAVIAKSAKERDDIWAIRGEVEWLVKNAQNFDVSLRSSDVGLYIDDVSNCIKKDCPGAFIAFFGHLGDNNLHMSVLADGENADVELVVERHVYECLGPYQGAISAEHGIGLEKKSYLSISRSPQEIALMKTLKTTLDPNNILNPGKVLDV